MDQQIGFPERLTVSPSPHIKRTDTTRSIMLDVIIALVPALLWGVYVFGPRALVVVLISVASAVLFEYLVRLILHRSVTVGDLSAVVTGLLLGLNLPSAVSYWIPVVGSFFAIVVVKQLFGGIGKNFLNPALAGRAFLFAWPEQMTTFTAPFHRLDWRVFSFAGKADAIAEATPLAAYKAGELPSTTTLDLFLGRCAGSIGEVSAVLLIVGGIYLICRRVITWHIPVAYIGTVALLTFIFPKTNPAASFMLGELVSGGLMLGAVFMATDYTTSPVTPVGRLIFGFGCGCVTVLIRYFGGYNEGVSFAILMMNMLVYYIDRFTAPRVFGTERKKSRRAGAKEEAKAK
mgnify:CR=1 FL=1